MYLCNSDMKRVLPIILFSALMLCGCSKTYKDIKVTSFDIVSVTPKGLNQVEAVVDVGLSNPIVGLRVTDLTGTLMMAGDPCLSLRIPELDVQGRMDKVYRIPVTGTIQPGFNPLSLLSIAQSMDLSSFTADLQGRVWLGKVGKNLELKNLKIGQMVGNKLQ